MTASSTHPGGYNAYYGRLDNTRDPRAFWHPARKKTILFITCNFDREVIFKNHSNETPNNSCLFPNLFLGNLLFRQKNNNNNNKKKLERF